MSKNKRAEKADRKKKTNTAAFPAWIGYLMVAIVCVGTTLLYASKDIERRAFANNTGAIGDAGYSTIGDEWQTVGGKHAEDDVNEGDYQNALNIGNTADSNFAGKGNSIGSATERSNTDKGRDTSDRTGGGNGYTFVDNWFMDTRVKYVMDGIWHRMGNVNEILDTASRIRHTSELSWYREWYKTAERIRLIGDECLEKGHDISAGEAYLRASNYYLAAEVMLHTNPDDKRILETYKKGGDYFMKAMQLLSIPATEVRIPYEDTKIKGYFFRSDINPSVNAPILLIHQGYDAPIESTKHIAEEAIRRGCHCLLFDGPGQGLTIREQGIPFTPNWENVVSAVVDYAATIPGVDEDNIMLMGISMGGGFAVRAAAYEPRIKLCILNPGYLNVYEIVSDYLTDELMNLYEEDPEALNEKMEEIASYDVGTRWGMYHGMWVFGAETPSQFLDNVKKFDNTGIIDKIRCKVLVMDGTSEVWGEGQAKQLYDKLTCEKYYMRFSEEDSASEHCQVGAGAIATQRMFDWIDENMR